MVNVGDVVDATFRAGLGTAVFVEETLQRIRAFLLRRTKLSSGR